MIFFVFKSEIKEDMWGGVYTLDSNHILNRYRYDLGVSLSSDIDSTIFRKIIGVVYK